MAEALLEVGVMFAAIAAAGVAAKRLNQSVIPFYLLTGILLSQWVAGRLGLPFIQESAFIVVGAELGIVFLLFFLGLEFNLERLLDSRTRIGAAGLIDLAANFGGGFLLGYALFRSFTPAFLVAGIVYISSSAIITKSLIDLGWIANRESEPMLGTLVFEDLFIAVYLAIASALVLGGNDLGEAATSIGIAIGFLLALLLLVWYGTAIIEHSLDADSNEFVLLRTLGIVIPIAGAGLALGVSEAVAAFFMGMAFSATTHVDTVEPLLEPIRDTFAAVFFFWIGLVTDPFVFLDVLVPIAVAVLITTPTKLASGYLGGWVYGIGPRRSIRVGLGMVTRGEFSLIIASLAASGAGLGLAAGTADTIYGLAVGYVLVMSVLGTMLMQHAGVVERAVGPRLEARALRRGGL